MLKTKVVGGKVVGNGAEITVQSVSGGDPQILKGDIVLVSTGRKPFTQGLGASE